MNWRIHWIGTDRTFQQLMNTGSRSNSCRTNNMINVINISVSSITRFQWRKLRVMMMMLMLMWMRMKNTMLDLIFIHSIRRWNTLNAIQVHENQNWTKSKKEKYPVIKIENFTVLIIWVFLSLSLSFLFLFNLRRRKGRWWSWIDEKSGFWGTRHHYVEEHVLFFEFFHFLSLSYRGCLVWVKWEREKGSRTVGLWYLLIQRWIFFIYWYLF